MRFALLGLLTLSTACLYGAYDGGGGGYSRTYGAAATTAAHPRVAYHDRAFDTPASELDGFIAEQTAGYAKEGAPIHARLDGFEPVPVALKRGRCYRMVVRLDDGASFSAFARRGVVFVYHNGDRGMEVNGGPGIHGPTGAVASAGCPQANAAATFDIIANWGSAMDKSHVHDLGTGGVTLQLYAKRIGAAGLARLKADEERQIAESEAFKREEQRKARRRFERGCRVCEQRYVECIADWRRGASRQTCAQERDTCAFEEAGLASARDCAR
jgi:hypothetical protein